jgi:hypothetical protein
MSDENKAKNKGYRWRRGGPSPNPGGRPRTAQYAAAAREFLASSGKQAPKEWGAQASWTKAQLAVWNDFNAWQAGDGQAGNRFLDRAEGRPLQESALGDNHALAGAGGMDVLAVVLGVRSPDRIRAINVEAIGSGSGDKRGVETCG